ncbi:M56 family metallopeptidase [Pontibacter vulgaris]|uniref:M56 family metallopeptidase n=1 Tax=Pontibacter vulgaris TaxID=2905679 RepID=UPI001FA7B522|nr:M56 family metallopeptidase [Pontibacter vulgaris]
MPTLLLYLLKVNIALVLFYLAYQLVLRKLTFYTLNRLFLVFGIVFSTVYPFIDLAGLFAAHEPIVNAYMITIPAWAIAAQPAAQATPSDYWQLPVYLFWAGLIVMLVRFILQFVSLYKLHAASEPAKYKNIGFREVKSMSHAFSFWQTIYLNPAQHTPEELESILRHEMIHITGWHTLDVLLTELSTVFYWFNPGAWLIKKAVKENLEFIADQHVVDTGVDKREYQYLLLKVVGATQPQIANQFNFPSLKQRIVMMNKKQSSKANQLKLLIVLPLVTVLLFAFRSADTKALTAPKVATSVAPAFTPPNQDESFIFKLDEVEYYKDKAKWPEDYKDFLKRNPGVQQVGWKFNNKKEYNLESIVIYLKNGETEVYDYNKNPRIPAAEAKYGTLPNLPPPPPPVRVESPAKQKNSPGASMIKAKGNATTNQQQNIPAAKTSFTITRSGQDSVIYFVDGKRMPAASIKSIDPKRIVKVDVVKGEKAREMADGEAVKGVVNITTTKDIRSDKNQKSASAEAKALPEGSLSKSLDTLPTNAVYILDDKEVSMEKIKQLAPDDIKAVSILKNSEKMVQKYGPKASNGVIMVYTKK